MVPKVQKVTTEKVEVLSKTLDRVLDLVKVSGCGTLKEVYFEVDNPNVRLVVEVDGIDRMPHHNNLKDLLSVSPYLNYIDALQFNDTYVVHVSDIKFLKGFSVYLQPLQTVTLRKALVLYDLVKEG